jgi:hypothetical protein
MALFVIEGAQTARIKVDELVRHLERDDRIGGMVKGIPIDPVGC